MLGLIANDSRAKLDPGRVGLRVHNLPEDMSNELRCGVAGFVDGLGRVINSYRFTPKDGVGRVGMIIIANSTPTVSKSTCYGGRVHFIAEELPASASREQARHDDAFQRRVDDLLRQPGALPPESLGPVMLYFMYNRDAFDVELMPRPDNATAARRDKDETRTFESVKPRFRLDQVVLNEGAIKEIRLALATLEHRHVLYEAWGFREVEPRPKAIVNLYGPPGTGKTMTAHAIAGELGRTIVVLSYADIESKFVGEAPRNLVAAFGAAAREGAVLFFDEADSFLGKRIDNISTSSDQAVNALRSQMLMLLDDHEGVVIFSTNLIKNYDRAFESRIFKHIELGLPDEGARARIVRALVPPSVPLEVEETLSETVLTDLARLSDGFSGRDIKNAILESLTRVLSEGRVRVTTADFMAAFECSKEAQKSLRDARRGHALPDPVALTEKIKKLYGFDELAQEKLSVAVHAAFADGAMTHDQWRLLDRKANDYKIPFVIPDRPPGSSALGTLVESLREPKDRRDAIGLVLEVLVARGSLGSGAEGFLRDLGRRMGKLEAAIDELVRLARVSLEHNELRRMMEDDLDGHPAPA